MFLAGKVKKRQTREERTAAVCTRLHELEGYFRCCSVGITLDKYSTSDYKVAIHFCDNEEIHYIKYVYYR